MTIDKKTVLVLGAGASKPYGYPLGSELKANLEDPSHFLDLELANWFPKAEIADFCNSFMRSGMKSIDAYLSRRGNHILQYGHKTSDVGKAGISLALRREKTNESLFHGSPLKSSVHFSKVIDWDDNWYQYLWDELTAGIKLANVEDLKNHKLTIISFNYDLSLEHYLYTATRNSYGTSQDKSEELLSSIKFIHVYGKLAGNPFSDSFNYVFDFNRHQNLISEDVQSIKVIDEDRSDDAGFKEAQNAILEAEKVCFLGFGFDRTNVARLNLPGLLHQRAVNQQRHRYWPNWYFGLLGFTAFEQESLIQKLLERVREDQDDEVQKTAHLWGQVIRERFFQTKSLMTLRNTGFLSL